MVFMDKGDHTIYYDCKQHQFIPFNTQITGVVTTPPFQTLCYKKSQVDKG